MANPVGKGAAIFGGRAFDWARNANEFGLEGGAGSADDGIPVSAHVHEGKVRRQITIGQGSGSRDIAAVLVFKARPDAML